MADTRVSDYVTPLTGYHESSEDTGSSKLDSNYVSLTLRLSAIYLFYFQLDLSLNGPWGIQLNISKTKQTLSLQFCFSSYIYFNFNTSITQKEKRKLFQTLFCFSFSSQALPTAGESISYLVLECVQALSPLTFSSSVSGCLLQHFRSPYFQSYPSSINPPWGYKDDLSKRQTIHATLQPKSLCCFSWPSR